MREEENKADIPFLAFFTLLGFVLLALIVTASNASTLTNAVQIYVNIFYFSIILIVLSYIFPKYFGFIIFGKPSTEQKGESNLVLSLVIGGVLGFLIVSNFLSVFNINFIPQQFQSIAASQNGIILFLTLLGPIFETILFVGILIPTFKKFIKNLGLPFMFLLFAIIIIYLTAYYAIGILLVILAVVTYAIPALKNLTTGNEAIITLLAITFASTSAGIYHVKAYADLSSPQTAIFGAIAFFFISGYLQELLHNNIAPQFMHIVANDTTAITSSLTTLPLGIFIILGYLGIVALLRKVQKRFIVHNPLPSFTVK